MTAHQFPGGDEPADGVQTDTVGLQLGRGDDAVALRDTSGEA
jgi:hypothetical protein